MKEAEAGQTTCVPRLLPKPTADSGVGVLEFYLARPLKPCDNIFTLYAAPEPTMYSVLFSGPANARFCGVRETGMTPCSLPCASKTWTPASVAA
jgi:hypothetical protein